jgi:hypothetical protein
MRMGYWENTTYIHEGNTQRLSDAMVAMFAEEGVREIARPATREPEPFDSMQYAGARDNRLWGVAVFPGSNG